MEGVLKAAGLKTNFTVAGYTHGLTEEATMVSTSKTKSMDSESTFGQIKRSTRGTGRMENSTVRASSLILRASQGLACGRTGSE